MCFTTQLSFLLRTFSDTLHTAVNLCHWHIYQQQLTFWVVVQWALSQQSYTLFDITKYILTFSDLEVFPGCDHCIKDLLLLLLLHRDCCHIIIIHSIPTTFLAHVARYQCLCRLAARDFICLCWYSSFSLMGILELICPPSFKTGIVESNKNPDHLSTTTCTRLWKSVFWATSYQHDSIKAIKDAICFMQ